MGIRIPDINFILRTLEGRRFERALILGYQTVFFDYSYLDSLKKRYFHTVNQVGFGERAPTHTVDCMDLFRLLASEIDVMDISDYEGANLLYDLSADVSNLPCELVERYDFILDWGTSEHVFNVINCYKNVSKMLKKGGTFFCLTPMNSMPDHGFFQLSPCFYFDFFKSIFKVRGISILRLEYMHTSTEKWTLYPYYRNCIDHLVNGGIDDKIHFNFVHCEKLDSGTGLDEQVLQYQFVEHWTGLRRSNQMGGATANRRATPVREFFFGLVHIGDLEPYDNEPQSNVLRLIPSMTLTSTECM